MADYVRHPDPLSFQIGNYFKAPRCGKCAPKHDLEEAPKMVKVYDPDGFICGKCGLTLVWHKLMSGELTLKPPE